MQKLAPSLGLTAALGEAVARHRNTPCPPEALSRVRRGVIDALGVLLAGRDEEVVKQALTLVSIHPPGTPGLASVLIDRASASASDAALINAVAAHALDYDDTGLDGHPSVVLAPVVMALGECNSYSVEDQLNAYLAGYEVWAELIGRDADKHHGKGWHPTAIFGTVAAAAAAAQLLGLTATQCSHALGLSASMAAGLVANFGSMTKPLQVGFAARNGLLAAQLAAQGVTAAPDALESPRGFLAAISPQGRVRLDGPIKMGVAWQMLAQGINIKRYPVCYAAHRVVDAALQLHQQVVSIDAPIESIRVQMGYLQAAMLRNSQPTNSLDAKFSAQYAVACALLRGQVGLKDLQDESVQDPLLQALMPRIEVLTCFDSDTEEPLFSPQDQLEVRWADGRILQAKPVRRAQGHAKQPLDDLQLHTKFLDCALTSASPDLARILWTKWIVLSSPT